MSTSPDGIELPPIAATLMQSLRAVGYSLAAALADLVDNSIAAGASRVEIDYSPVGDAFLAVVDDGSGMTDEQLITAMRFGSRDPRDPRSGHDLGRFGLGLKTASLSQCRRVTVFSRRDGRTSAARWDLDECERRGTWWLARPHASDLPADLMRRLSAQGRGTVVLWERLDRLSGGPDRDPGHDMDAAMDAVADHLAMVFHRFLAGEISAPFEISINGRRLPRLDPFLEGHTKGQALHTETFYVEGKAVHVSPFVLPFPSRLKPDEMARAGGRDSLKTGHGFYIYRGGRLVVPGGWFRIVPADELIRLARVRVDVPVELDHLWKIDIRKTVVEPPPALRPELKRIVGAVTLRSRNVYRHRGTPRSEEGRLPLWRRTDLRDNAAAWRINRDHPLVAALLDPGSRGRDIERLLRLLEECLPLHDIHLHISNDLPVEEGTTMSDDELSALAQKLADDLVDRPDIRDTFLRKLHLIEPFSRAPELARRIAEGLAP